MNKPVFVIGLLGIIISSGFMVGFEVSPQDQNPNVIRVMSFNIHQFFVGDEEEVSKKTGDYIFASLLRVIQQHNPDIIGLQEAEGARLSSGNIQGIAWLADKLDMYYYYGSPTSEQTYGNPILSVWPIQEQEYKIFPRPEGIEREVTHVKLDTPYGILRVFNTHFEIGRYQEAQRQEAEFLLEYIGEDPAIITGDFNTAYNDTTYNLLNETLTYGSIEAGIGANSSVSYTVPARDPTRKIDYIWLTEGDWTVIPNSYKVIGTPQTSDHLGIVVDIQSP